MADMRVQSVTAGTPQRASATAAARAVPDRRSLNALIAAGRAPAANDPAMVQRTAGQMVSELFLVPLLSEMRKLPFGKDFGGGGRAEEVFGEQLDTRLADIVAQEGCGGLTKQIAKRISPRTDALPAARAPAAERTTWLTQKQAGRKPA